MQHFDKRVVAMRDASASKGRKVFGRGLLAVIFALMIASCDQGNGPQGIINSPATPLPDIPAGFCDPINFEVTCTDPEIVNFNGGATVIVDNPGPSSVNDSDRVARMQKFGDQVFGGTRLNPVVSPVDFSAGEAYRIAVWSERPVPVTFKLEETTDGTLGVERVATHSGGSVWEELCFDFTGATVNTIGLTIIFDNGILGAAVAGVFSGDWTFYYDEITQVEDCAGGTSAAIDPDAALFATDGMADLTIPDDYAEITPFGSGSVIDEFYADDQSFSPVISVFSGSGYGANVAQIGFIGFQVGFLGAYESVDFKVKGMPNQVVFVRLFDGVDSLRINLTSSAYSTVLFDGWYQVSIPVSAFENAENATGIVLESDNTAVMQFRMLLTDIGFSGTGSNPPPPPPPPFDSGLLTNGDFEAGVDPWLAGVANPIGTENVIDDNGNAVYFVDVMAAGNAFDVNLSQMLAITPDETYTLSFRARSNVARTMLAGIGLSGGSFANETQSVNLTMDWQTFTLELTATGFGDATSRVLFDMGAEVGQVFIDDVSLVVSSGGGGGGGGTGELSMNGNFETGDFTGWQQFVNSGVQSISMDTPANGGTFSAAISGNTAPGAGGTTEIKQANVGVGTLAVGDVLTISFDVKGTFGPGGQLNVLSFTEFAGGGADLSDQTVIAGGVDDWTTQSYNVTLSGSDAGGGFSLAFNPVCGAVTDCVADVFIDNVSIVRN